ncbi:hypothetical protein NPIL_107801 [Nephila pilipes]|uniref:Uncharacterized protein n=1 Tax=Nephila pilipes TaxID=299642 RepID=A0A8X6QQX5_NEPPI|nr:hypothetical protein NPIL_107801 [Nephila pilipes]
MSIFCVRFYQLQRGKKLVLTNCHVGTPIKESTLPHILSTYQRLASNELFQRCISCGTQMANDNLHYMIWSKCVKEILLHKYRVKHGVAEAIASATPF